MKQFILTITLAVFSVFTSFSQEKNSFTSLSKADLVSAKNEGAFIFTSDKKLTNERVQESAKYYGLYFKVGFNADKNEISVNMITNDEKSRHIIVRFLVSLEVSKVKVDGTEYSPEDYFQTFLK